MLDTTNINRRSTTSKRNRITGYGTPEQIARACLAETGNNPERAIALARRRLREIYLAQIKKAEADYFDRIKRAAVVKIGNASLRATISANGSGK